MKESNKRLSKRIVLPTLFMAALSFLSTNVFADTILHAFNWSYEEVGNKAEEIADIGYTKVLVAPPLKSSKSNCAWWARYQPQDIRTIEHCLGNKESFQSMIDQLSMHGVDTYADIVLNHMANERNHSTTFPGSAVVNDYKAYRNYWERQKLFGNLDHGIFSSGDFNNEFCISNYNDWWQSMHGRICGSYPDRGLPDLDPNSWVREQQRSYLRALKNMGVKGFRIDAAKHMTNWHINQIFTSDIKKGMHIFGEIIVDDRPGQGGAHDTFLEPFLRETGLAAYDFPLFKTIREAFKPNGSLSSLHSPNAVGKSIGWNAVTFTITHDIPTNDGFRYQIMNATDEHLAHVYIMGRKDGMPLIFSDKTGVDNNRWYDFYNDWTIKAMIKFRQKVKGQPREVLHADNCTILIRRGHKGFFGINKCGSDKWIKVNTHDRFYWSKIYRDVFSSHTIDIDSGELWVKLPARGSRMWYAD